MENLLLHFQDKITIIFNPLNSLPFQAGIHQDYNLKFQLKNLPETNKLTLFPCKKKVNSKEFCYQFPEMFFIAMKYSVLSILSRKKRGRKQIKGYKLSFFWYFHVCAFGNFESREKNLLYISTLTHGIQGCY